MENNERFPLDEATISIVAETNEQAARCRGALMLFIRQHKLQGNWRVAENQRELELVKDDVPQPVKE